MQKPVAVILLNWNTPVHTSNCISSLLRYGDTSTFDIIVADNGSTDGSLAKLQSQFPQLTFIDNKENLGFAEGNNRAIRYSISKGYTYSLIMNNDTEIDEDIIGGLILHLQHHPIAAAVQPSIYWMHDKTRIWNGKGGYNKLIGKVYSSKKTYAKTIEFRKASWLTGCCVLVRNEVLEKVGLFNKQFFLYDEDVELSFRIRSAGHELHYLPHLKIYHEAGASGQLATGEKEGTLSPVIHYYVSRNRIWFLRKFGDPLFYPAMLIYYLPYYLAVLSYFLIRGRKKKAGFLFNGLKDGFFTPGKVVWPESGQIKHSVT
ncbi:glycosyltransferase family 2 protein [Pedobacter hartonius]|uniref:Glycosyltransferase, GT2 family n=1 Tax=Pedobacter hartonius TaxID=425514 RepID=A0A1H4FP68_9SPHI|nr:glycosyltransferase family 2 protein [Pedobacter hartonius]SEA99116.1 Glycosyltransferase, GT2 family [Pedobacter hartonius]